MPTAVIIGAGSAGLAAAAALLERGVRSVVLEQGDQVATSWRQRHEDLRLNTIRWLSGLPGSAIPRQAGRWVSRDDYIAYLERYALEQALDIRFGVCAQRLTPTARGWQVGTDAGVYEAAHVVVATGNDRVPWQPQLPGLAAFGRPVMHVAQLRRAADLAGQRVLLIGAGNSAVEIAGHLVDHAVAELWMSVRRPPNILPRQLWGIPLHPVTVALRYLPEGLRDRLAQAISRHAFGDLSRYGLPTATDGPFRRMRTSGVTAAIDQGFVDHLAAGKLRVVADVTRLTANEAVLCDGTRVEPDVIVAATGYRSGLADLLGPLDVLDQHQRPRTGKGRQALPGLWLTGFWPAIEGNLRRHGREAGLIADGIATSRCRSAGPPPHSTSRRRMSPAPDSQHQS
ncbi:NAD(P)/FAD-dependent oxidoreductase [Catellatospora sp. TT07R-123]|uniref:flavin-containing monooxygenase n=1 Tax=Catellatospora sp. TT07R-123 TaxID=2733863 RepID=UPI001BB312A3|nr:NAD(P)/FAD-dependent oxidoreductase [Catellatospora sp. TT07R-123]